MSEAGYFWEIPLQMPWGTVGEAEPNEYRSCIDEFYNLVSSRQEA